VSNRITYQPRMSFFVSFSPVPCRPGPVGWPPFPRRRARVAASELLVELLRDDLRRQPVDVRQELRRADRLGADVLVRSVSLMNGTTRASYSTSDAEERRHLTGHVPDRLVRLLAGVASAVRISSPIDWMAFLRSSSAISSDCCAGTMSPGTLSLAPVGVRSACTRRLLICVCRSDADGCPD